jgi:hypothetical protein
MTAKPNKKSRVHEDPEFAQPAEKGLADKAREAAGQAADAVKERPGLAAGIAAGVAAAVGAGAYAASKLGGGGGADDKKAAGTKAKGAKKKA